MPAPAIATLILVDAIFYRCECLSLSGKYKIRSTKFEINHKYQFFNNQNKDLITIPYLSFTVFVKTNAYYLAASFIVSSPYTANHNPNSLK